MTDSQHDIGDDVRDTVLAAGLPADATFTADLRARLAAVAAGDIELEPSRPERSRAWIPLVAAAAVVALVVGAITLIARERDPGVVPGDDLPAALVGSTWVALDAGNVGDLPTLEMKIGATRPDVLVLTGTDGCNEHTGEFRLDGSTVADATIQSSDVGCPASAVIPHDGATLSISGDVLTVSDEGGSTAFTAIRSLPVVAGAQLDGEWAYSNGTLTIADGQVTTPAYVDGTAIDLTRALAVSTAEVWAHGDSLVFRTPTTGFRRLDPVIDPGGATLLDQLVGRTWVGVDGPWATTSPTLVFDSLNSEPGVSALSVDDGCNSGGGMFRLDGGIIVGSEITVEERGCAHEIAHLTDGTTLTVADGVLTVTGGPTTTFVALDSLEAASPSLDGTWLVNGATFSIAGGQATSADTRVDADAAVNAADVISIAITGPVEAWRYGDGWIVRGLDHYVQLTPVEPPADPPAADTGPVVTTGPLDGAEAALIEGTLGLIDGCLVVGTNETMFVVVWQPGTTWDAAGEQVVLPEGRRAAIGDFVRGGGGYHAVGDLGGFGVDDAGIAAITPCADRLSPEVAVVQSPVDIIPAAVPDPAVPDDAATLRTYLDHAAAGRYTAAGDLLQSGALESDRRSDLRPLLRDELGLDDLGSALEAWCTSAAICTSPTTLEPAGTGVYAGTFDDGGRTVTGYFRSGTFEGTPEVKGLPPRRPPAGDVVACPTTQVVGWVEADLDGDGAPETVVTRELQPGQYELVTCNTALAIAPFPWATPIELPLLLAVVPDGSGRDLLFGGGPSDGGVYLSALGLSEEPGLVDWDTGVSWDTDVDGTGRSFGCTETAADSYLGSGQHVVSYEYRFVGGTNIADSTGMDVVVRVPGPGPVLDEYTLTLPGDAVAAQQIIDPTCNGVSVFTD